MESRFGTGAESFVERSPLGQACLAAFAVTDSGRPLIDSYTISSLAWALGRTRCVGPFASDWLEGFDGASSDARDSFAGRVSLLPEDEEGQRIAGKGFKIGTPIDAAALERELIWLQDFLSWPASASDVRAFAYIRSAPVASRKKYSVDDFDFLNSFFVNDLRRVGDAVAAGRAGEALRTYLSSPESAAGLEREDVRRDTRALQERLQPKRFPSGRWPSPGHWPLVLSQQVAVNATFQELSERAGIFAVNGPPGSGKTTLLRDLIAAIVVRRADSLARLASPEAAFTQTHRWRVGQYWRSIRGLQENLLGHEIVVASSNNGAVENVTREIPSRRAVDESWLAESSYFAEVGTAVIGDAAWALLAAPLGNKQNRSIFASRFWYGLESEDEVPGLGGTEQDALHEAPIAFLKLLKQAEEARPASWPRAVRRYKEARRAVEAMTEERQGIADALERIAELEMKIFRSGKTLEDLEPRLADARSMVEQRRLELQRLAEQRRMLEEQLRSINLARPGFLPVLLSWGKAFKEWSAEAKAARGRFEEACRFQQAAGSELDRAEAAYKNLCGEIEAALKAKELAEIELQNARTLISEFRARFQAIVPDTSFWEQDEEDRERRSPWADCAWNDVRARLFLAALDLHRSWILSVPEIIRRNLQGAVDILTGNLPDKAPLGGIKAAWATLFLVIPVVSTTFASFDRLFSSLGQEDLGWLLIDEAGQAVPQAAVGAIWRARRVVVVGDPQQLEPVVTISESAVAALRSYFAVDPVWQPNALSVQSLADRATRLGTSLPGPEGSIWVGAPLRVHRRCDEPMFSIANGIAYDGLMVFGTGTRAELPEWSPSRWIDIEAGDCEGNWIPEEGRIVLDLMKSLPSTESVVCLSPFRHVVFGLRDALRTKFPPVHVGTVHTYQGKEAEAVILVLGGNLNAEGPLDWAASRPNLLNVAVTRARRRLYVVGNRKRWRSRRFFSELARRLPHDEGYLRESKPAAFDLHGDPEGRIG
ncbi:MAG TPA: AAA domain-containing protein [Thermoanaerobaculia bacterium]|jgi:uncharacterized coiled-coil protein SlyX|nr:AAA domain-containing protein [Thermoanaerobaculia bacterium]